MTPNELLRLSGVDVVRGATKVIDNVSLSVQAHQRVALMGHNGSGKTSLLRALEGLLPIAAGELFVRGEPMAWGSAQLRSTMGVVFQEYSHDAKLTVRENLLLGARLFGVRADAAKRELTELAQVLELGPLLSRRCEHLSGGQRRRVELARALMHKPALLVLDEPSVGLDPGARRALWALIAQRQEANLGILFTTHDAQEAAQADYVVMLGEGRALAAGKPADLLARCPEDVIVVEGDEPSALFGLLKSALAPARCAVAQTPQGVEVRVAEGHTWVQRVVEALHDQSVAAVHLRRASLADVMVQLQRAQTLAQPTAAIA